MKSYLKILKFCKPYKLMVGLSIISSLLFALLNAITIWLVGSLITSIMSPNSTTESKDTSFFSNFQDLLMPTNPAEDPQGALWILCIMLVATFLLKNIFFYINNISLSYVQNRMIVDIRNKLFNHLTKLPLSFYHKNKTGEITSIAINDVTNMRTAFAQSIQNLINQPLSIIIMLIMLFMINVKLTLIMLISAPLSFTLISFLVNSIKRKAKRSSIKVAGLTSILQEMLTGIKIVKSFISEKIEYGRFKKQNDMFFGLVMKQDKLRFLTTPINEMIGVILGAVLLWIGGSAVLSSSATSQPLEAEKFVRFIIFLFAMLQPVRKLTNVASVMQQGIASSERVFSILDVNLNNQDENNVSEAGDFNSSIEFKNVCFTYEGSKKPALKNINFEINKGDYIALIGESGAGKSTTIDLVMRFFNANEGVIKFDNKDIKNISKESIRKQIGIVPQDIILFNDSVKNNISYGVENASLEDIKRAAEAANAIEFINELPDGFDTIVGERGTKLSGGQKQRLSIARAIFRNPKILIMDEATSSLDSEAEKKVKNAIDELVKDRTVIVIAHRLSTIINADKILVFENGEIVDSGKHDDLINSSKTYKNLYQLQFKGQSE